MEITGWGLGSGQIALVIGTEMRQGEGEMRREGGARGVTINCEQSWLHKLVPCQRPTVIMDGHELPEMGSPVTVKRPGCDGGLGGLRGAMTSRWG